MGGCYNLVNFTDKEWIDLPFCKPREIWGNTLSSKMVAAYISQNIYSGTAKELRLINWVDLEELLQKPGWSEGTADLLYYMFEDQYKFHKHDLDFLFDAFTRAGKVEQLKEIIERMAEKQ